MNIFYYTIDDLRLPAKRLLRKGRSVEQFPTLEEALARYRALPAAGIRALGLTDGVHVLELVKCLPLFPDDREGEDVLASDYRQFPPVGPGAGGGQSRRHLHSRPWPALSRQRQCGRADPIPGGAPPGAPGEIFMAEPVRRGPVRHPPSLCGRNRLDIPPASCTARLTPCPWC